MTRATLLLVLSLGFAACSTAPTEAPAEVTQVRAHSAGGMEFDLRIENPLDESADAHCSVKASRAGHSVVIETDEVPAGGERTLTTRMEHLPDDIKVEGLVPFCTLDT